MLDTTQVVRHYKYNKDTQNHAWDCDILFINEEPISMGFYIWNLGDSDKWEEVMAADISEDLGYKVEISGINSGNGHGGAKIRKL